MKLRDPLLTDQQATWIAAPLVLLISPALAMIAAIVGLIWLKRRLVGPAQSWQRWFAWHPVKVATTDTRWLESVERRSYGIAQDTQYRALA